MYYAVDPNPRKYRVLLFGTVGYDENANYVSIRKNLEECGFIVTTDRIFVENRDNLFNMLEDINPDFYFQADVMLDLTSQIAYGWCIGRGIQELSKEFYNDMVEMMENNNGE